MAIGTSGYIESVHYKPEPMKPDSTLQTLKAVGALANLVSAGASAYQTFSNANSVTEVASISESMRSEYNKLSNGGASDTQLKEWVNGFKTFEQDTQGAYAPATYEAVGKLTDKYNSAINKTIEDRAYRSEILNYSKGTATAIINGQLSVKQAVDLLPQYADNLLQSRAVMLNKTDMAEGLLYELTETASKDILDEKFNPNVDTLSALKKKYTYLGEQLASDPRINSNAPVSREIRNSFMSNVNNAIKQREGLLLQGAEGYMNAAIENPDAVKNKSDIMEHVHTIGMLKSPAAAQEYVEKFQDSANFSSYLKAQDGTNPIDNSLLNTDAKKVKAEKHTLNLFDAAVKQAVATGDAAAFDKVARITQSNADLLKGYSKHLVSVVKGGAREDVHNLYNMMQSFPKDKMNIITNLLPKEDLSNLLGVIAMDKLNGNEKTFQQTKDEIATIKANGIDFGTQKKEVFTHKEDAAKNYLSNAKANMIFNEMYDITFAKTRNPNDAKKAAQDAVDSFFYKVDGMNVDHSASNLVLPKEAVQNLQKDLTTKVPGITMDGTSLRVLADGSAIVLASSPEGEKVVANYSSTDLDGFVPVNKDQRSSPEVLKLKNTLGNLFSTAVENIQNMVPDMSDEEGLGATTGWANVPTTGLDRLGAWGAETANTILTNMFTHRGTGEITLNPVAVVFNIGLEAGEAMGYRFTTLALYLRDKISQGMSLNAAEIPNIVTKFDLEQDYTIKNKELVNPEPREVIEYMAERDADTINKGIKEFITSLNMGNESPTGEGEGWDEAAFQKWIDEGKPTTLPMEGMEDTEDASIEEYIQGMVGVTQDGVINPNTRQAIRQQTPEKIKQLQSMIGTTPDGDWGVNSETALDMYLNPDIRNTQQPKGSRIFASGKYQVIPSTMMDLVKKGVISPNDKYDAATQDKIANYIIEDRRPDIQEFIITGQGLEEAQLALAKEWASFPVPVDTVNDKGKTVKAGDSYYGGANKAHVSLAEVEEALKQDNANVTYDNIKELIGDAESKSSGGVNAYNQGTSKKGIVKAKTKYTLTNMTIAEILKASLNKQQ